MLAEPQNLCLIIPNIAYALAQKIPPEAELITIAVAPEYRRNGLAENLLIKLWQDLQHEGISTFHLEVNETLAGARALYQKLGWETVGRRKNYYQNSAGIREDAILMRWQTPI